MRAELAKGRKSAAVDTGLVEWPWDLPDGWRWERLDQLADLLRGVSYNKKQAHKGARSGVLPLLRGGNIQGGAITLDDLIFVDQACVSRDQMVRERDIVLTMSSGSAALVGKSAWVSEPIEGLTFGAFCACLRSRQPERARWLFWFLQTPFYRQSITNSAKGTSINNLKRDHLGHLPVPVPSDVELPRLVARVDALLSEIDEGEAALADARTGVETYRKALLKAAVTGELTAYWRQAKPPQETGEQLLARTLADRRTRWQADPKNARKKYVEPTGPDSDGLPNLPEGWAWANLDQLSTHEVRNGLSVKDTPEPTEVRALRLGALASNEVDWSIYRYLPRTPPSVEGYRLEDGDLLVSRANGSPELVGKGSLCTAPPPDMIFPDTAIRFRLLGQPELRQWIVRVWNSLIVRHQIGKLAKTTAGILKISQGDISRIAVPIPGSSEMAVANLLIKEKLAVTLDGEFSDRLDASASTLRQSILAAAFRGELA